MTGKRKCDICGLELSKTGDFLELKFGPENRTFCSPMCLHSYVLSVFTIWFDVRDFLPKQESLSGFWCSNGNNVFMASYMGDHWLQLSENIRYNDNIIGSCFFPSTERIRRNDIKHWTYCNPFPDLITTKNVFVKK